MLDGHTLEDQPKFENTNQSQSTMNSTASHLLQVNTTTTSQLQDSSGTHSVALILCTIFICALFLLGTCSNLIVLVSFFDPALRKFRNRFDFMILNLSLCDLLVSCISGPALALALLLGARSAAPPPLCHGAQLLSSAFPLLSLQTVTAIAVQRLLLVLGHRWDKGTTPVLVLLVVIILCTLGLATSASAALHVAPANVHGACTIFGPMSGGRSMAVQLYTAQFLVCMCVVTISYVFISHVLLWRAHIHKCAVTTTTVNEEHIGAPSPHSMVPQITTASSKRHHPPQVASTSKDSKALATCVLITLSTLMCCTPIVVALVLQTLGSCGELWLSQVRACAFTLLFAKSGLNPFLYARWSTGLRRRVSMLLICLRQRQETLLQTRCCRSNDKPSQHENSHVYFLSPKRQLCLVDKACGPSLSWAETRSELQGPAPAPDPCRHFCLEPYHSIYSSSSDSITGSIALIPHRDRSLGTPSGTKDGDILDGFVTIRKSATTTHFPLPSV